MIHSYIADACRERRFIGAGSSGGTAPPLAATNDFQQRTATSNLRGRMRQPKNPSLKLKKKIHALNKVKKQAYTP